MGQFISKFRITILLIMSMFFVLVFMLYNVSAFQPRHIIDDVKATASAELEITSTKGTIVAEYGSVIDSGKAAYFYAYEPILSITPELKLSKSPTTPLIVQAHHAVYLHTIDSSGKEFWSYDLDASLSTDYEIQSTDPLVIDSITLDMPEVFLTLETIREELDSSIGVAEVVVKTVYTIKGTIEGHSIIKTVTQLVPITLQKEYFSVVEKSMYEANVTLVTGTKESVVEFYVNDIFDNQLPMLGLLVLLLIGSVISTYFALRQKSIEQREHNKFKEWITEGSVELSNRTVINIESLEGLVDLAIDTDKRVIYDKKSGQYVVILEDVLYRYFPISKRKSANDKGHLGVLLLKKGLLTQEELETGLYYHQQTHKRLGEALLDLGMINSTVLYSELAYQSGASYLDVEHLEVYANMNWLDQFSIMKAKTAHMALVGERKDGTKIVATVYPVDKERKALIQKLFGEQVRIVATSPIAIHNYLDRLEDAYEEKNPNVEINHDITPVERLGVERTTKFVHDYMHGLFHIDLFVVASGYISYEHLKDNLSHQTLNQWINNASHIHESCIKLLYTLKSMVQAMYEEDPSAIIVPDLLSLLNEAGYLSSEDIVWVETEMRIKVKPMKDILLKNYFITEDTLIFGERMLRTLQILIVN